MTAEITYEVEDTSDALFEMMRQIRPEDETELERGSGELAEMALADSIANAKSWGVLRFDGHMIAIVGLSEAGVVAETEAGCPWLVGTSWIDAYKVTFVKWTRDRVSKFLSEYALLVNWADSENKRSLEWLESIGFTLLPAEEFGPNSALFVPFYIERGD